MPKGDVASRTLRRPLERPNAAALRIFGKSGSPALAHLVDLLDALVFTPPTGLSEPSDWIDMTLASGVNILEGHEGPSYLDRTEPHGVLPIRPSDLGPTRVIRHPVTRERLRLPAPAPAGAGRC